ncbi:MAG TPA: AMP-binding protein, partial [Kofleriaceae bacterium]|nr:AMP-binding protein [Kofleriaceae bacterium]
MATATGSIDYTELLARAQGFAAALCAGGLARGDRVAVWLPNGVDWVVAHWGIALAGGVVVPIGTRSRPPEIHHVLGHCRASALVMIDGFLQADHLAMLAAVRARGLPGLETVVVRRRPAATAALPDGAREWDAFVDGVGVGVGV